MDSLTKVVVLSGGVGGTKLVHGFAQCSKQLQLKVIGNVADDDMFYGLWVSPDIDTLTYTLAGVSGPAGWGIARDSFHALDQLRELGMPSWMALGDRDLGVHIFRTERRRQGRRPSDIASEIAQSFGIDIPILLPTDDPIHTRVKTNRGWLSFQEYFVRERTEAQIHEVMTEGIGASRPTPEALDALRNAELIVIAPSNPIASIAPILGVPGIRDEIRKSSAVRVAVSPIIAGRAVRGPADRMLHAAGYTADVAGVLSCYEDFLDAFIIDEADSDHVAALRQRGVAVHMEAIVMRDEIDRLRLAKSIIDVGETVGSRGAER